LTCGAARRYNRPTDPAHMLHAPPAAGTARRSLRILMLAPEPFFEPRGTPFSEYHRLRALTELGHHVDLVTYPLGADVAMPNLRIIRSSRPPFITRVPIGPSFNKLVLDAYLTVTALRQARRARYDAIHSHEEMGVLGVWLAQRLGIPHLYDMHSSLPQQLTNFGVARSRVLRRAFEALERRTIFGSDVVITICQDLYDHVERMGAGSRAVLIENVMGGDVEDAPAVSAAGVRARWGIAPDAPVVLYTGTFEPYQGLDMLIEAMAVVARTRPDVRLLVVGGRDDQVAAARAAATRLAAPAIFTGHQPARDIPAYVEACDLLASPRIRGTNTPLKIYSYLRSGKPIVATRLLTHLQVLDDEVAALVPANAAAFAIRHGVSASRAAPPSARGHGTAARSTCRRPAPRAIGSLPCAHESAGHGRHRFHRGTSRATPAAGRSRGGGARPASRCGRRPGAAIRRH
jgi:glycosyltransferase involved in cell wall biosynthesis